MKDEEEEEDFSYKLNGFNELNGHYSTSFPLTGP